MLILNRNPISSFARMHNEFNDLFDAVLCGTNRTVTRAAVPMNVWEEKDRYFIEAELPGYTMNDIEISVLGDEVTVKGERKSAEKPEATYLRRERAFGSFARTWTLPAEVNADHVEATLRDGVLLITLPKAQQALPRKIEVKTLSK